MPDRPGEVNIRRTQPGPAPGTPMEQPARTPANILLVDDNPNKLLALETALAPLGEVLIKAGSGAEALRELLARDYAVIILDVSMPVMDGFETARTIRGRPRSENTPIIFASAINLGETDALRGYSLGAVDYILAPIVPDVLRAKVSVFVQLYRMNEEAKQRARQLEESQTQLRLAERMASLGTLAAGLGHDMGNLLLPIQTRLEDLDTSSIPADVRDCLSSIGTSINYLSRLASGLRLLALGPGEDEDRQTQQSTDVAAWWNEIQPLLRNAVPRGIELRWEAAPGLPPAAIAKHLLTQLVFNLVQNAGEVLRVRGRGAVSVKAEASGGFVLVRVNDNGPGMTAEVRQRCLEPFFTTKSRTLSTGLGLAMVNGIIQRAGGVLEIDTVLGVGTTFTCRLPAAPHAAAGLQPRNALITVADERMRAVVTSLLRVHGFDVNTEANGQCDALLWVTDANQQAERQAAGFLSQADDRRLLILGGHPAKHAGTDKRIVHLAGKFAVAQLRAAVSKLARREATAVSDAAAPDAASSHS